MKLWARLSTQNAPARAARYRLLAHVELLLMLALGLHSASAVAQNEVVLVGSGSSVPAPLYGRWTQEYGKHNAHIQMRYLPAGTSEGIKQISHGVSDFGAGEYQLTDMERKQDGLLELPVVLIGIVPIYNLPGVHRELRLSGEVLAEIFLGDIRNWNAAQIAKLNPDVALPTSCDPGDQPSCGQGVQFRFHGLSRQGEFQVSN